MYGEAFTKCYVVFLSNEQRTIPLWKQNNAKGEDKLVIWVSKYQVFSKGIPQARVECPRTHDSSEIRSQELLPSTQSNLVQVSHDPFSGGST